jgi:hypothetical protein
MADEVENILREIADRVRAEQAMSTTSRPNGESAGEFGVVVPETGASSLKASLARIDSYLTTTGRAWDRLPPVVSNRSGTVARLELWIKNFFKRTTRWYAWEQVNFNAAVHHALRETLNAFAVLEMETQSARRQLVTEYELLSRQIDAQHKVLEHEIEIRGKEFQHKEAQLESQASQIAAQRAQIEALMARLSDLSKELRERSDSLLQEQRVGFKQLSLEMSEVVTLFDRRRRELETRLANVEKQPRGVVLK